MIDISQVLSHLRISLGQLSAAIEKFEEIGGDPECRNELDDIADQLRSNIKRINGD